MKDLLYLMWPTHMVNYLHTIRLDLEMPDSYEEF